MSRRLNVELGFTANVSQAQAQLNTLKTTLKSIANTGSTNLPLNDSLKKAVDSAKTLQTHLNKAFNQSTGNIDLGKLQTSLSASGDSLTKLSKNLLNAGTTGEKSFVALQNSITNANVKLTQSQTLMQSFAISLKNAARWQLSSSILHGFMGSLQTAYGYAQDLNESLNNIRIVTGYGADKMASFALEANKAAQALSTTTTKYTDASLIFYQQGLSDKEVLARTETAIKLANVSRQSTQEVSDQMTAIWNNFYDGSKSLEYYADAITALGAKTASSSDEIATGLSKFAAIGDTVGLSYEYATASLATITAQTRQSADVVGNALKTLFARIQGLKMDEKQEDGTDFNKYSKALLNVGVSIKDANGELKEMDQILDELGARWNSLSKNQQMATAQTVAGVRQYTQLIALMDNWDIMQENVAIARNSSGTLQEQADIYAESWEAARSRVRAALESIYGSLVDDKFFISMNNNLAKVINGVDNVVKSLGGFKGALLLIANIFLTQFQGEIVSGLQTIGVKFQQVGINISNIGKNVDASAGKWAKLKGIVSDTFSVFDTSKLLMADLKNSLTAALEGIPTDSFRGYVEGLQQINSKKEEILRINSQLNSSEKSILETHLQELTQLNEEIRLAKQKTEEAENYFSILQVTSQSKDYANKNMNKGSNEFLLGQQQQLTKAAQQYVEALAAAANVQLKQVSATKIQCDTESDLQILRDQGLAAYKGMLVLQGRANVVLKDASSIAHSMILEGNQGINVSEQRNKLLEETKRKLHEIVSAQEAQGNLSSTQTAEIRQQIDGLQGKKKQYDDLLTYIRNIGNQYTENTQSLLYDTDILKVVNQLANQEVTNWQKIAEQQQSSKNALEQINKIMDSVSSRSTGVAGTFTAMITGASSLAMSINTVKNSWEQLNREDASFVDKLVSGTMLLTAAVRGLGTVFSGAVNFINLFVAASKSATAASTLSTLQSEAATMAERNLQAAMASRIVTQRGLIVSQLTSALASADCTKAQLTEILVSKTGLKATEAEIIAEKLLAKCKNVSNNIVGRQIVNKELSNIVTDEATRKTIEETIATKADTAAKEKQAAAQALLNLKMIAAIAIIAALVIGIKAAIKAHNADAEAAEKAAKTSEELNRAAEETTERLNKIKDAVSGYNEAVTALQNCTKGTEEWNAALSEVQDKVAQLLEDFPELLANADLFNRDGTLNTEVLDEAVKNAQTAADNADAAALWGQVESYRATAKSDITDLSREGGYASNRYSVYSAQGQYMGRDRDQAERDVQTIAKHMDEIKQAGSTAESVLNTLGIQVDKTTGVFTDAQKDFANSLLKTVDSYNQAATAADNASEILVNSWADDKGSDLKTGQAELMSAQQKQDYDKYAKAIKDANIDNSFTDNKDHSTLGDIFKGTQFEGMSITDAFNKARGVDYELARNGVRGTDNNRTYAFLENGETKEYKLEEIQSTIAAAAALEKLTENAAAASQVLNTIDQRAPSEGVAEGLKGWIANGDLSDMTQADFDVLKEKMGGDTSNIRNIALGMEDVFGMDTAEELATNFGENFAENFQSAMVNYETSLNTLMKSWAEGTYNTTADYLDALGINDDGVFAELTKRQQTEFAQAYRSIFEQGGKEGLDAANAIINAAKQQGTDFAKVADLISSTDWSNWDSIDALQGKLGELGITIDDSLIASVQEANHVTTNAGDAIIKTYAEVSSIIQDLQVGDIISPDDFNKIEAMGMDMDRFFTKMADGTYQLTEDADVFYSTIMGKYRSDLLDEMQGQQNDLDSMKKQQFESRTFDDATYNRISTSAFTGETPSGIVQYNDSTVQEQLDLIAQMRTANEDMLANWQDSLKTGFTVEELTAIADAARQAGDQINSLNGEIANTYNELAVNQERYLASASTLEEFDMLAKQLADDIGEIDLEAYSNALISVASQYENCTDEIEQYNRALKTNNAETIKAAEANLRLAATAGELAKKYDLNAKDVETQARLLQKSFKALSGGMEMSADEAVNLAAANQRMNRGVSTLNQNFKTWAKTLATTKTTSQDYANALNNIYDALADLVGATSAAVIPIEFLSSETAEGAEHMKWLEQAASGDVTAINLLGTALASTQVELSECNIGLVQAAQSAEEFADGWGSIANNDIPTAFQQCVDTITTGIDNLHAQIQQGNIKAGEDITRYLGVQGEEWIKAMNMWAVATGATVEDVNALLNEIGVPMQVTMENVPQDIEVPVYTVKYRKLKEQFGPNLPGTEQWDGGYEYYVAESGTKKVRGSVAVGQIKATYNPNIPDRPSIIYAGTSGAGSSAGSVGGGSAMPGVAPSSTSSGGSGGGGSGSKKGGGSGSSKEEKPKEIKPPEEVINEATPAEKKDEHTEYNDMVGRYHRIEDALDNLARAAEKAADASDKLYGRDKLDALTTENKLLQNNIWLLEQKKKQAKQYLDFDKGNMEKQLGTVNSILGLSGDSAIKFSYSTAKDPTDPTYDVNDPSTWYTGGANGDILNYNEIQAQLHQLLTEREAYYNNPSNFPTYFVGKETETDDEGNPTRITQNYGGGAEDQEAWKEQNLDPLVEAIELFDNYVAKYDETKEGIQDINEEIKEDMDNIRAKNAEKIKLHFETQLTVDDRDRAILDWMASRVDDNVYTKVEFLATKTGQLDESNPDLFGDNRYATSLHTNLAAAEQNIKTLKTALEEGKITQAEFVDGMRNSVDSIMENVDALREYNATMRTVYADVIPQMTEEIDRYTDSMEYCTSVLNHYESVAKLANGFIDYKWETTLYDGMLSTIQSQKDAADKEYEIWKAQAERLAQSVAVAKQKVTEARESGDADAIASAEENLKFEQQNYDAAVEACKQSYEEKLTLAEEYIQTLRKKSLAQLKDILSEAERQAFNGYTMDQIKTNMEHLKTVQEDYLNGQKKAYEINKMLRKMNQDMSKTQNKQAQQQIKAFYQETVALGNRERLSEYELEIQQKRYDLLLAQQSLLETQNAKTHVTLRRDEEGNYGYIYTADQEQIDQANQTYEDKYYALFETVLNGYEDFYEKMVNNEIEYWREFESINTKYINGEYQNYQDYQRAIAECDAFYSQRRLDLADETGIGALALQTSLNIQVDTETGRFVTSNLEKYTGLKVGVLDEHTQMKNRLQQFYQNKFNPEILDEVENLTTDSGEELTTFGSGIEEEFIGVKTNVIDNIKGIKDPVTTAIGELNTSLSSIGNTDSGLLSTSWINTSGLGQLKNLLLGEQPGGTDALATLIDGWGTTSETAKPKVSSCISSFTTEVKKAVEQNIGGSLQDFSDKVQAVATSADNLNKELTDDNGVYKRFSDILTKIQQMTDKWKAHGEKLDEIIQKYRDIATAAEKEINYTIKYNIETVGEPPTLERPEAVSTPAQPIVNPVEQDTTTNPAPLPSQTCTGNQYDEGYTGGIGGGWNCSETPTSSSDATQAITECSIGQSVQVNGLPIANDSYASTQNLVTAPDGPWNDNPYNDTSKDAQCNNDQWSTVRWKFLGRDGGVITDYYKGLPAPVHVQHWNEEKQKYDGGGYFTEDALKSKNPFLKFDSGGYTGIWDNSGKLALLHQKELVLNQEDTSNILSAVDIIRSIVSQLDLQALSARLGLLSLNATSLSAPIGNETIDQNVKIEATFPNVSDRNEIEEAFNDLVNTASQYAHRKI